MNTPSRQTYDSLLFDMDGTLWDAVDSYCAVWNAAIDACCPQVPHVTRPALELLMGKPIEIIYDTLVGSAYDRTRFMAQLARKEEDIMPVMGGRLYDGVRETLALLSKTHRLFMVSNCTPMGPPNFMQFTGLGPYFTDGISFGENGLEKDRNIDIIIERHNLKAPLYIGDTMGDCRSAHADNVPFAWASYGFGRDVTGQQYTLQSITDLPSIA